MTRKDSNADTRADVPKTNSFVIRSACEVERVGVELDYTYIG